MDIMLTASLAGFAFASSITPGPNNVMLMTSGTNYGVRRTVPHWLGVGLGFGLMLIGVGAGLTPVFDALPWTLTALKAASGLYLLYLAWRLATAMPAETAGLAAGSGRPLTFLQAAAFQWVNPKAWAMALAAVSIYALGEGPMGLLATAAVFVTVNLPCCGSWVLAGQALQRLLKRPSWFRVFNVAMALALIGSMAPMLAS